MQNNLIISIVGTTATGKTNLALELAHKCLSDFEGVDIISADSRQVYKGIEIISGADIPEGFVLNSAQKFSYPFFSSERGNINLHGLSIIVPEAEWSITHFQNLAFEVINFSQKNNRLPIIVGGTGLYHYHLFNYANTFSVKPNQEIREKANEMTVEDLQNSLRNLDPKKLLSLNNSDLNNKRRLVRAIEISLHQKSISKIADHQEERKLQSSQHDIIGLRSDLNSLKSKIEKRVLDRFEGGALTEINVLNTKFPNVFVKKDKYQINSTLGINELMQFIEGKINEDQCLKLWALHEFQYAKRQITWWKNKKEVIWLNDLMENSKQDLFYYMRRRFLTKKLAND